MAPVLDQQASISGARTRGKTGGRQRKLYENLRELAIRIGCQGDELERYGTGNISSKTKSFRRGRSEAFGSYITGDPHFGAPDRKLSTDIVSARFAAFQREA